MVVVTAGEVESCRILSDFKAKRIKGAFFSFIIAGIAAGIALAVSTVVTVALSAITGIVAALGVVVGGIAVGLIQSVIGIGTVSYTESQGKNNKIFLLNNENCH